MIEFDVMSDDAEGVTHVTLSREEAWVLVIHLLLELRHDEEES